MARKLIGTNITNSHIAREPLNYARIEILVSNNLQKKVIL